MDVYIEHAAAPADGGSGSGGLEAALATQAAYVREALGRPLLPAASRPAGAEVLASEAYTLGTDELTLVLTRPAGGSGADGVAAQLAAGAAL